MTNKSKKVPPKYYIKGELNVTEYFPDGIKCCKYCSQIICLNDGLNRYKCRATGEIIDWAETGIGLKCPIVFKDNKGD